MCVRETHVCSNAGYCTGVTNREDLEFPEGSASKQATAATYNAHILASLNIFKF